MFYSQFVLAKKGPLGTIWIAAHLEGKLRKNQVTDTNISASIDSILFPEVPIALRLSGHLLLGVVRIYSRKVNYLFHDCSEALVKIKNAFHCSIVDLPPEAAKVPFHSITLPETFDFDELEPAFKWDKIHAYSGDAVDHHISERDLITLQEQTYDDAHRSLFPPDERFAGSSDPYSILYESDEEYAHERVSASNQILSLLQENGGPALEEDVLPPLQMDELMDVERENMDYMQHLDNIEQGGPSLNVNLSGFSQSVPTEKGGSLASGPVLASLGTQDIPDIEKLRSAPEQREPEPLLMELEDEVVASSSTLKRPGLIGSVVDDFGPQDVEAMPVLLETPLLSKLTPSTVGDFGHYNGDEDLLGTILGGRTPALKVASSARQAPESAQQKRGRRKRKAVFDDKQVLSSQSMKKQLAGAADLLRQRRKKPLTEFEARRMEHTYNDQRFDWPSFPGLSAPIKELYSRVARLSATEQSNHPTPRKEAVKARVNEDGLDPNTMAEVEISLADIDSLDGGVYAPFSSPLRSPQDVRQTPANVKQDEGTAQRSEVGPKLQDLCDTLPSMDSHVRLFDEAIPDALATQGSDEAVDVIAAPLYSPSSRSTPGQASEKLDFLKDGRDKVNGDADANEDHFVDETDTGYHKRGKHNQNNTGWSVRSKCVAKYLKSIFEGVEPTSESQPVQVSLDELLKGRTRKEAARMYFEILVLKSRDYINVEQKTAFAEIKLSATHLLQKDIP